MNTMWLSLPLCAFLIGCSLADWKEVAHDTGTAAVRVVTETPESLTTPTGAIGALIGIVSTVATQYLYKKFKNGNGEKK